MRPPEPFIFLLDRCLGRGIVRSKLQQRLRRNERVEILDDHFAQDAADELWIPDVGSRGWVILTKDQAIQRRPNEQQALLSAETAVFVFVRGGVPSERVADAFVTALPSVRKAIAKFEVPLLGRINLAGEVSLAFESGQKLEKVRPVKG